METSPFETLPRVFLPIAGRYLPPLFYYGWSVDSVDLYNFALTHDLIRDALAEITNKPAATIDIPSAEEVDGSIRLDVADYVVLTAAEKCGITIQPMADSQIMPAFGDGDVATVFVLYDNHHFNYALTAEQVQVLQAKLERADPPKWYADGSGKFQWGRRLDK